MRYRLFGRTGLRVSELFLGAMRFGSVDQARPIIDRYAEAGGNVIDTAARLAPDFKIAQTHERILTTTSLGGRSGERRAGLVHRRAAGLANLTARIAVSRFLLPLSGRCYDLGQFCGRGQ